MKTKIKHIVLNLLSFYWNLRKKPDHDYGFLCNEVFGFSDFEDFKVILLHLKINNLALQVGGSEKATCPLTENVFDQNVQSLLGTIAILNGIELAIEKVLD